MSHVVHHPTDAADGGEALRLPELDTVRILLIDDDPQAMALIGMALTDAPFHRDIELAATARAGLDRIGADQHDVFVVDQHLPDGTGIEIIRTAKAAGVTKPFILLTGHGSGAVDEAASREGAADYVEKHMVSAHLERSIRYALRTWQAARLLQAREEQLRQAQKMEAIGRLAGAVAHHFNNLLTAIIGYSELIDERCTPGDRTSLDVAEIRDAANRAAQLTRQMLAFSRKQFLNTSAVDLNDIAAALLQLLPGMVGDRVETTTVLADDLARVNADAAQIEQALVNLVLNAHEAMPDGGRLTIETANVELTAQRVADESLTIAAGRYAMFRVSDTGVGMDADTRARAFEPFFSTRPRAKGTTRGLGLATAYGIVDQSGGGISIETAPGQGTTVRVYLPVTGADEPRARGESAVGSHTGTETLLVVDDDDGVRTMTVTALRNRGYTVYEARSGEEAIEWAQASGIMPRLLVTDVLMPGLSGPDLASRLTGLHPTLRVLFMSGYTDDPAVIPSQRTDSAHRESEGNGSFRDGIRLLQKPFTPAQLGERVRLVLDSAPQA